VELVRSEPGIYCLEFVGCSRPYVGSAKNCVVRLRKHLTVLLGHRHPNKEVQQVFDTYGMESFRPAVLEYVDDIIDDTVLERLEQDYFDEIFYAREYFASDGKDRRFFELTLNRNPIAIRNGKGPMTEEQKKRASIFMKQQFTDPTVREKYMRAWFAEEACEKRLVSTTITRSTPEYKVRVHKSQREGHRHRMKTILAYDAKTGVFIGEFEGIRETCRKFKLKPSTVKEVIKGKRGQTGKMWFCLKTGDNYPKRVEPRGYWVHGEERKESMKKVYEKRKVPILVLDKDGRKIGEYPSASDVAKKFRISQGSIHNCLVGRSNNKTAKGMIFKYADPDYVPKVYNKKPKNDLTLKL